MEGFTKDLQKKILKPALAKAFVSRTLKVQGTKMNKKQYTWAK